MTRALRVNKVPMVDQVATIRASLREHPLSLVPESTKLAKDAFLALRARYGDEERVMSLRLGELKKCGKMPETHMAQVSWFTDLIGKMQRIVELGGQSDDLAASAFGVEVFNSILTLFPSKMLSSCPKDLLNVGSVPKEGWSTLLRSWRKKGVMPMRWTSSMATRTSPPLGEVVLVVAMEAEGMLPVWLEVLAILNAGFANNCKPIRRVASTPTF